MFSRWRSQLQSTLGLRLAVWYTGVFLVSSVVVVGATYVLLAWSLRQRDRDIISDRLAEYAVTYRGDGLAGLRRLLRTEQDMGRQESLFVRVLGPFDSAVFFRMPRDWGPFDLRTLRVTQGPDATAWAVAVSTGDAARLEVAQARLPDGTLLQVGKSTDSRDQLLRRFRVVLALVFAGCALVGVVGGGLFTRSALRPVRDLATVVTEIIETGRVDRRVPAAGHGDALGELVRLFNAMLDRIEVLLTAMRGSLDNVAHDLRTPLTRLRASAERTLAAESSPEELREALADCAEESTRVATMLTWLMDISEAEMGRMRLELSDVNLKGLLDAVADMYAELAETKDVALTVECPGALAVRADEQRLRQVVANLLDNAVKYTASGGQVTVRARCTDGEVEISVADTGPGILAADLPHIWDRLYRADQSRSEEGLGLGLSLVKAVVEAHGATITVDSALGRGSTFTIHLPVRSEGIQ